jgi:hypothetical protein
MEQQSQAYIDFITGWHQFMIIAAIVSGAGSIVIYMVHRIKSAAIKTYKGKYDYLKLNQARAYQIMFFFLAAGVFFIGNTVGDETVSKSLIYIFVRLFISLCVAVLFGYITYLILKFYYPTRLEKRLVKLRYTPRISKSGHEMHLLSELEEDVHLDEGMQAEENVFSVDYDVWVDDETGEVQIEKYHGYLQALECGSCGFQTLTLGSEEILKPATEEAEGSLLKNYKCTYCQSVRTTQHPIAKILKSLNEYRLPEDYVLKGQRKVKSIMMEIISTKGDTKEFFFQSTAQAKDFLENFDFDKANTEHR